jgi:RNA-directed DNA polymerase
VLSIKRFWTMNSSPLFETMVSLENLFFRWEEFRRGKRKRKDIQAFERHLEDRLFALHEELSYLTYSHGTYHPFKVFDPKERSISRASVKDRFVHHLLYCTLCPIFDKHFIYHSLSCRTNKGTHLGVSTLVKWLKQVSLNGKKPCFTLKVDIRRFFDTINHSILKQLIRKKIFDAKILLLCDQVIDSFYIQKTPCGRVGLPLGNVTSQLFANLYLHELDLFIKHTLKRKHYLRYCDDFIFLSSTKSELINLIEPIAYFLHDHLSLTLHPHKIILRKLHQGVDFLGTILFEHHKLIRTKTKRRILRKLKAGLYQYQHGTKSFISMDGRLQSYLGALQHVNQHTLTLNLLNAYSVRPKRGFVRPYALSNPAFF